MESSSSTSPFRPDIVKGKVPLITGGGSGICFEIATQLGLHGAAVAIMGRRKPVLDSVIADLVAKGIPAIGIEGDVRKKDDATRVLETTFKHFGRLDILVNGAAGNFLASPEDLSPNALRTVMEIDTLGTYTMSHEAMKYLKKGGPGKDPSVGGLILNISATLHYTRAWYQIHVSAAKAAVDSITRSLALEWSIDYDIRVNGIAPGPISGTPGASKLGPEEMKSNGLESEPLFKLGEKWDIAMVALYFSSAAELDRMQLPATVRRRLQAAMPMLPPPPCFFVSCHPPLVSSASLSSLQPISLAPGLHQANTVQPQRTVPSARSAANASSRSKPLLSQDPDMEVDPWTLLEDGTGSASASSNINSLGTVSGDHSNLKGTVRVRRTDLTYIGAIDDDS